MIFCTFCCRHANRYHVGWISKLYTVQNLHCDYPFLIYPFKNWRPGTNPTEKPSALLNNLMQAFYFLCSDSY